MILISRPSSPQCFQTDGELESEGLGQWFVHKTKLYTVAARLQLQLFWNIALSQIEWFKATSSISMPWLLCLHVCVDFQCVYLWAPQQTAFGCGTLWLKISIPIFRNNYNFSISIFQCPDNSTDNKKTSHIYMATLLIILNGQSKFHSTSFYVVAYTQLHVHQLIEPLQLTTAVVSFVCYITAHQ